MKHSFTVGQRVYWTDPDPDGHSGPGTITRIQSDDDDAIISLALDDGGECEVLPHEIVIYQTPSDNAMRAAARKQYQREGSIEIDAGAVVSRGDDNGAYVAAWVWVDDSDATDITSDEADEMAPASEEATK